MVSTRAKVASVAVSASILLLGWQVGARTMAQGGTSVTTAGGIGGTTTGGSGGGAVGGNSGGTTEGTGSGGTTSGGTGPATGTGGTSTGTGGSTTTSGAYRDGTYKGKASSNPYESITVAVTISGSRIADATATVNGGNFFSKSITSQAVQQLKGDVISAQSAKVSTVSGATYSSMSYLTSLQSALDQARA